MQAQDIRPKLPHDTMFLPSEEGIVFRRAGRTLALKGKGIFQVISTLAPHLSGQATSCALTRDMAQPKANVVVNLLATLVDNGMLIHHSKEDEEHLSLREKNIFASQIEFLEHLTANPCQSFRRFRDASLFLTGSGFPLAALACSLIRNGAGNLAIDSDASMGEWAASVFAAAHEMQAKGLECNLRTMSLPATIGQDSPTQMDAVCYASDGASIHGLLQINRWCRNRSTLLIPGIPLGDAYHIGPIVSQLKDVCWECALLRYTDQCPAAEARDLWQQAALGTRSNASLWPDSSPAVRIFANTLGFEVYRVMTGLTPESDSILSLDVMTLETKTTQVFTHPKCRACEERNRIVGPATRSERQFSQEPLEAWNEKLQAITPLVDKRFGLFHAFEDDHINQTPLFRSALLTSERRNHVESAKISATSLDNNASARIAALLRAASAYALQARSPEQIVSALSLETEKIERIPEERIAGYMGGSRETARRYSSEFVIGRSVRTGATRAVPAGAVFPAPRNEAVFFEPSHTGTGCGFSMGDASLQAIHSALAFETLKCIAQGELTLRRCRMDTFTGDRYSLNCLRMLEVDCDFWAVDLDGFALTLATSRRRAGASHSPIVVGYGADLNDSLTMATRELLATGVGDESASSLHVLLPAYLGYHFPQLPDDEASGWISVVDAENHRASVALENWLQTRMKDVVVCDITPRDLASSGLFVVKAVVANESEF